MAMEKNAVYGGDPRITIKTASAGCPICGKSLDMEGSLPRCPSHGTAPFERGASFGKDNNVNRFGDFV